MLEPLLELESRRREGSSRRSMRIVRCAGHCGEDDVGARLNKGGRSFRAGCSVDGALLSVSPDDDMRFVLPLMCSEARSGGVEDAHCSGLWKDNGEQLTVPIDPNLSSRTYSKEEAVARVHCSSY